jgi:ATP synthase protein I
MTQPQAQPTNRWQHDGPEADPWSALSLVISGVLLWGAIGYGVSEWLGSRAWMGVGVVIGGVLGVLSVYLRYGRAQSGPPLRGGPVAFQGKPAAGHHANPASAARPVPSTPPASQPHEEDTL